MASSHMDPVGSKCGICRTVQVDTLIVGDERHASDDFAQKSSFNWSDDFQRLHAEVEKLYTHQMSLAQDIAAVSSFLQRSLAPPQSLAGLSGNALPGGDRDASDDGGSAVRPPNTPPPKASVARRVLKKDSAQSLDSAAEVMGNHGSVTTMHSAPTSRSTRSTQSSAAKRHRGKNVSVSTHVERMSGASIATEAAQVVEAGEELEHMGSLVSTPENRATTVVAASLPAGWPSTLKARAGNVPKGASQLDAMKRVRQSMATSKSKKHGGTSMTNLLKIMSEGQEWAQFLVIDPESIGFYSFEILGLLILTWDMVTLPFLLAWDIPFTNWVLQVAWATLSFWCLDASLGFVVGYYEDGELVKRPSRIARRYLRGTFWLHFVVICSDFIGLVIITANGSASESSMVARSSRALRLARLVRTSRFMRMLGMLRAFRILTLSVVSRVSQRFMLCFKVGLLYVIIIWVGHFSGCLWFWIGRYGHSDTNFHWTDEVLVLPDGSQAVLTDLPTEYQYATAFHWSIAQLTLGAIEVRSYNSAERIFSCCCLILALVGGSMIISSLSAQMVQYQMLEKDKLQQLMTLRKFLWENGVESKLAHLAHLQAVDLVGTQRILTEKDVPALEVLSSALQVEIRTQLFSKNLCTMPLFKLWWRLDVRSFARFCKEAVEFTYMPNKHELFYAGLNSKAAYLLMEGRMIYMQEPDTSPVEDTSYAEVKSDSWLCEASLWVYWIHVGKATAIGPCKLITVGADDFNRVLQGHGVVQTIVEETRTAFVSKLACPSEEWPTDVHVEGTSFGALVATMKPWLQESIGNATLDAHFAGYSWVRPKVYKYLKMVREEVSQFNAVVVFTPAGDLERSTWELKMNIMNAEHQRLVQLARIRNGHIMSMQAGPLLLPHGSQDINWDVDLSAWNFFLDYVPTLRGSLWSVTSTDTDIEEDHQKEIRAYHKKFITTVDAKLHGLLRAPTCSVRQLDTMRTMSFSHMVSKTRSSLTSNDVNFIFVKNFTHSSGSSSEDKPALRKSLMSREVYAIHTIEGDTLLCTWLAQCELDVITAREYKFSLAQWLSGFDLRAAEEEARQAHQEANEDMERDDEDADTSLGGSSLDASNQEPKVPRTVGFAARSEEDKELDTGDSTESKDIPNQAVTSASLVMDEALLDGGILLL